MNDKNYI
jgi:hypothetical protein